MEERERKDKDKRISAMVIIWSVNRNALTKRGKRTTFSGLLEEILNNQEGLKE